MSPRSRRNNQKNAHEKTAVSPCESGDAVVNSDGDRFCQASRISSKNPTNSPLIAVSKRKNFLRDCMSIKSSKVLKTQKSLAKNFLIFQTFSELGSELANSTDTVLR